MPVSRISLRHRPTSSTKNLCEASADSTPGSIPDSVNRAAMAGSASTRFTVALSHCTRSGGIDDTAKTPCQVS